MKARLRLRVGPLDRMRVTPVAGVRMCREARVVALLDDHLLDACRLCAARMLRIIGRGSRGGRPYVQVLGLEAFEASSQPLIDAASLLGKEAAVDALLGLLREQWPWPVDAYKVLLGAALDRGIRIVGLGIGEAHVRMPSVPDSRRRPPRGGLPWHGLGNPVVAAERNAMRVLEALEFDQALVLFGEGHLFRDGGFPSLARARGWPTVVVGACVPEWEAAIRERPAGGGVAHWLLLEGGLLRAPLLRGSDCTSIRAQASRTHLVSADLVPRRVLQLRDALLSSSAPVCRAALQRLPDAPIGRTGVQFLVPTFVTLLAHSDSMIRIQAAAWLGVSHSSDPRAPSALLHALSDTDVFVRECSAEGLARLCPEDPRTRSALMQLLRQRPARLEGRVHLFVALALAGSLSAQDLVVPVLLEHLDRDVAEAVRLGIPQMIATYGHRTSDFTALLRTLRNSDDSRARDAGAAASRRLAWHVSWASAPSAK